MRIDKAGSEVKTLNYRIKMSVFAKKHVAHVPQVRCARLDQGPPRVTGFGPIACFFVKRKKPHREKHSSCGIGSARLALPRDVISTLR